MPSPFTSSFASAAAGSNGDSASRRESGGAGDWSRNRANGATHTFRRPSANTAPQTRDTTQLGAGASNAGVYIPPHLNSNHPSHAYRNGHFSDTRYSKDELMDMFRSQRDSIGLTRYIDDLFEGNWDPVSDKTGASSQAGRGDTKEQYPGPEVCWNYNVDSTPLGLMPYNEEEKQLFSNSVNSLIKPQTSKDAGNAAPMSNRKTSLSGYGGTSGSAIRPGNRRQTSESYGPNGPLSPTESKTFFRTESNTATPPPALLRRRTDFKDEEPSPDQKEMAQSKDEGDASGPFGSLRRVGTAPMSGPINTSVSSPWSAGPASAFGGMGSFGSFNIGSAAPPPEKPEQRPGFGSARGGSRFKDLLAKTSSEDMASATKEKGIPGLEKLPEEDFDSTQSRLRDAFNTRRDRSETNPYDDQPRTGSAALSGSLEAGVEQMGFSSFATRDFGQNDAFNQQPGRYNEPLSPANTNPYHSPHGNQTDNDDHPTNEATSQPAPPFGVTRRMFSESEDRGGPPRPLGFGGLPGFGGHPGFGGLAGGPTWSSAGLSSGAPARGGGIGSAFGDPIFSPLADLQSPGSAVGSGFFGSAGFGAPGKSSRLGAMFPPAMQDQMRDETRNDPQAGPFGSRPDSAQQSVPRDPFDGNFARASGAFEDGSTSRGEEVTNSGAPGQASGPPPFGPGPKQRASTGSELGQQDGNQMPAAQQRQMVMPDRMRWIYRDPQGHVQGPWSGLEMHDWFKAGFFTAELLVKKVEDTDFEPLAQLVRRIGNSREPFLVPQIGVPHGPASATPTQTWPTATPGPPPTSGNAQPPFASAFPSFGTTLTAEQQNALERRKQEEQYLMARQKEHLAQQQIYMKQMHMQNPPHGLQHHSSAHSLHSQPSFGSISSPPGTGFQPSPLPPIPSNQAIGPPPQSAGLRQQEPELPSFMDRLNLNQRVNLPPGGPFGAPGEPGPQSQMLQDRARLHQQQQQSDMRSHQEAFLDTGARNDRLEEFKELRQGEAGLPGPEQSFPQPIGAQRQTEEQQAPAPIGRPGAIKKPVPAHSSHPSLSEQVAWTAAHREPIQPPPVSISPLPAPAAQRNRQHVADSLVPEPRSETDTPVDTPTSLAPWAERPIEMPKGPSLKEIQAAEAKKAAEQEAIAAAARRARAEQERLTQEQAPPPAPGLPSTSTWGTSSSPGTPTAPQSSVWAKQAAKPVIGTNGPSKKTLAQIQKEEEARKQRAVSVAAAAAQAQTSSNPAAALAGKRYAELAGKGAPSPQSATQGSAWMTVGSSGKAKAPATIVATPQAQPRSVSGTTTTAAAAAGKARPTMPTSRVSTTMAEKSKANEEFSKWVKMQLGKGLNGGINVDNFVQDLLQLPPEIEIIADCVYANSQTLDGRRIAEEFVRRRKLADKGVVEPAQGAGGLAGSVNGGLGEGKALSGGGWSEVAKKGPENREEVGTPGFKVVAGKKKGKR